MLFPYFKEQLNSSNKQGLTPVHLAAQAGRIELIQLFLSYPTVNIHSQDAEGNTALHYSTSWFNVHDPSIMLHLLKHHGGDQNIPIQNHQGKTALYQAVQGKSIDMVKVLL